jgi:hypothetical protein
VRSDSDRILPGAGIIAVSIQTRPPHCLLRQNDQAFSSFATQISDAPWFPLTSPSFESVEPARM